MTSIVSVRDLRKTFAGGGHDVKSGYREARSLIGLVPQEINLEPFETVMNTVRFSRGLFGKPRDDAKIEAILKQLSLYDKKDSKVMMLSGGHMNRACCSLMSQPQASMSNCARTCGMWSPI